MRNKLYLPAVIVFAGIMVASAVLLGKIGQKGPENFSEKMNFLLPVGPEDHFFGNPNAPVYAVVFSDYDCAFCASSHKTMLKLMNLYGKDGKMAVVFRHYPLLEIHADSFQKAAAAECASALYGEDAFWKITDEFFKTASTTSEVAEKLGLDGGKILDCATNDKKVSDLISKERENAIQSGAIGVPYTIFAVKGEAKASINGAVGFSEIRNLLEDILQNTRF